MQDKAKESTSTVARVLNPGFGGKLPSLSDIPSKNRKKKRAFPSKVNRSKKSFSASNTVPGPDSIVELARALREDVDLIYEWVYSNVDFYPMYGVHRGALGALTDGSGGAWEQAELMVKLLRQAGHTADFVSGRIRLNKAQIDNLLGTHNTNDPLVPLNMLNYGQILDLSSYSVVSGLLVYADIYHVWVRVNIGGTNYVFDPAMKSYAYQAANPNLGTITGFNETTLISQAQSGATVGADYIQNFNRTNVRNKFKEYGTNLLNWINTTDFDATMEDIIGGRSIQPQTGLPLRNSTLGYETPGDTPTIWTGEIPNDERAKYFVNYADFTAPFEFTTDEIYGKRLTLTFNANNESELRLDGVLKTTGVGLPFGQYQLTLTIEHPFGSTFANASFSHVLDSPGTYFIGTSFGPMSQSMVDKHQNALLEIQAAGGLDGSEPVLGESLAIQFFLHVSQSSQTLDILQRIGNTNLFTWHFCGVVGYNSVYGCPFIDLKGRNSGVLSRVGDTNMGNKVTTAGEFVLNGFEGGIMQQRFPVSGIATPTMLEKAISLGQKVFDATQANWQSGSNVRSQLTNYTAELPALDAQINTENRRLIIHENGATTLGNWVGAGWQAVEITGQQTAMAGLISGTIFGGACSAWNSGNKNRGPKKWRPRRQKKSKDPVGLYTGDLFYDRTDFSVGSGAFPYSLDFGRSYNSANRFDDGPLGKGWTHNHASSLSIVSNGTRGLGETSPKEAAGAIAYSYALIQLGLNNANSPSLTEMLIGAVSTAWLMDQLTNNSVVIAASGEAFNFIKLVDDTFNPPAGDAHTLVKNGDGTYTLKTTQQLAWNFDTNGRVTSFVDPAGMTVIYIYNSGTGLLESVSNGLGRTLTFSYTGTRLTSVSDGNGRSVQYSVDSSGNLVAFTDPLNHTHTFEYALPGQMTKIYLPKDPSVAIVENTYDSLGRVKTQKGADTGTYNYFFAGSRSEEVDPFSNSSITYWNRLGSAVRTIDALGYETVTEYDGLNRPVKVTMPEENSVLMSYDNKNNVLSTTAKAKPGSSLADIVNTFTFDPVWNKVATVTDGRGFITTFDYDNTTGRLLSVVQPQVDGQNPTTVFTYNSRGQMLTATDPTNIVTKNTFDTATEKLLSTVYDFGSSPHLNLTSSFGYNAVGDTTSVTDPRGNTTNFLFDAARRLTQRTEASPFGFITSFGFDVNDQSTSVQRQTGLPSPNQWQTSTSGFTITGMLDSITNPSGHVTDYVYDTMNRLLRTIDPENRTVEFSYDALSRVSTVKDPANVTAGTRTYTPNGMLASMKDARDNVTTMEYDGFDRLTKRIYPDTTFEWNEEYDANGNVTKARTRANQQILMVYDALNRMTSKEPVGTPVQTMTYDLAGRLKKISTPVVAGDPTSGDFEFSFDTAGRLIQQKKPDGKNVDYVLDANGNRTKLTYPDGYFVDYAFDELNRLTDIKLNGVSTAAAAFEFSDLSNRKKLTYGNGCVVDYGYEIDDDMNSLTHSFVGGSVTFNYSFDNIHQVKDQFVSNDNFMWDAVVDTTTEYEELPAFPINSLNQYTKVGGAVYSYNPNGCLTSNGIWTYGYDTLNRLTSATMTGVNASFLYDPLNRQGEKNVDGVKTRFLYDGMQRIEDYDSSGVLLNRFVYGPGLDEPLVQVSAGGTLTYLHQDRQSSLIAATNSSGALVTSLAYGPFGETSSLAGVPAGYTGQRFDAETGLYYYKARYYSPTIGRFLQPDPIGYADGMNLYSYVGNSPVTLMDPLGLLQFWSVGGIGWKMWLDESQKDPEDAGRAMSAPAIGATKDEFDPHIKFAPPKNKGAGSPGSGNPGAPSGGGASFKNPTSGGGEFAPDSDPVPLKDPFGNVWDPKWLSDPRGSMHRAAQDWGDQNAFLLERWDRWAERFSDWFTMKPDQFNRKHSIDPAAHDSWMRSHTPRSQWDPSWTHKLDSPNWPYPNNGNRPTPYNNNVNPHIFNPFRTPGAASPGFQGTGSGTTTG